MGIQYENAPITEALVDIRVDPAPVTTLKELEGIHELVREQYPVKKKQLQVQGQFSLGDEVGAVARQDQIGFSFGSSDGKQVFQARLNGFTFSRLRPYGNWIELRDEARRLWCFYRSVIGPRKIVRIAVRYINQIDIPVARLDYKDYFYTTPEVSPLLPQELSGFFMQLQMPQPQFSGMLILTQATVAPPAPGMNSVILDLDVFKEEPGLTEDDQVWTTLEELRQRKNAVFEGSLTDRARSLFGERKAY